MSLLNPREYCRQVRVYIQQEFTETVRACRGEPVQECGESCPQCGLGCVGHKGHIASYDQFPLHCCPAEHVWEEYSNILFDPYPKHEPEPNNL